MHVNKVSAQELVQGMRMRVECKREKKRMSVDIFRKKKVYLVPPACQGCLENDDLENEDLRPRKRRPTRKQ